MTPIEALTADAPALAPVLEKVMGWPSERVIHRSADTLGMVSIYLMPLGETDTDNCEDLILIPCERTAFGPHAGLIEAFRLQERVAELGLQERFAAHLMALVIGAKDFERASGAFKIATATPLDRCRAACAAWIEHRESK